MKRLTSKAVFLCAVLAGATALAGTGTGTPDSRITAQTKLSLWTTANVRSTAVQVDTNDGVVILYGKVPTANQRSRGEQAAARISGDRQVIFCDWPVPGSMRVPTWPTRGSTHRTSPGC